MSFFEYKFILQFKELGYIKMMYFYRINMILSIKILFYYFSEKANAYFSVTYLSLFNGAKKMPYLGIFVVSGIF